MFGREHIAVSFGIMWGEHLNSILASDNIAQKGHSCSALLEIFHVQSQGLWAVMGNLTIPDKLSQKESVLCHSDIPDFKILLSIKYHWSK